MKSLKIAIGFLVFCSSLANAYCDRETKIPYDHSLGAAMDGTVDISSSTHDLVVGFWDHFEVWNKTGLAPKKGLQVAGAKNDFSQAAQFSPDGKLLALANNSTVQIFDGLTYEKLWQNTLDDSSSRKVIFSNDGKLVLLAQVSKTPPHPVVNKIYKANTGEEIGSLPNNERYISFAFSPDSKLIVAGTSKPGGIMSVIDVETLTTLSRWVAYTDDAVRSVAFDPKGEKIVAISLGNTEKTFSRMFDLKGNLLGEFSGNSIGILSKFHPSKPILGVLFGLAAENPLTLWNTDTHELAKNFGVENGMKVDFFNFGPHGELILVKSNGSWTNPKVELSICHDYEE